jgi:hypothetical protein
MTAITIELSYEDAALLTRAFNEGRLPDCITGIRLADQPQAHLSQPDGQGQIDQDQTNQVQR